MIPRIQIRQDPMMTILKSQEISQALVQIVVSIQATLETLGDVQEHLVFESQKRMFLCPIQVKAINLQSLIEIVQTLMVLIFKGLKGQRLINLLLLVASKIVKLNFLK